MKERIDRLLSWLFPFEDEVIHLDMKQMHFELHDLELREKRDLDTVRVWRHTEADVKALKYRMLHGKAPEKTILHEVAPKWVKSSR